MGNSPTYDELMNATEYEVGTGYDVVILTMPNTTYADAIENQHTFLKVCLQAGYQPSIYVLNSGSEMLTIHDYETDLHKKIIDFACRVITKHTKYNYSIDTSRQYPRVVRV